MPKMKAIHKENLLILMLSLLFIPVWFFVYTKAGICGMINPDDITTFQFSIFGENNLIKKIGNIVKNEPVTPPVLFLIFYFWIKLFGISMLAARILACLISSFGLFVLGLAAKKIGGTKLSIITVLTAGLSVQTFYMSYQIRSYSLLFFSTSLALLVYITMDGSYRSRILFSFALLLLSYTHFFGILVSFGFITFDIFFDIIPSRNWKKAIYIIIYIFLFAPYFLAAYYYSKQVWGTFWPPVPNYKDILLIIKELCSDKWFFFILFMSTFFYYCYCFFPSLLKKDEEKKPIKKKILLCFWVFFSVLTVVFVYCRYIAPKRSVWVFRYFLCLYPFACIVTAYALSYIFSYVVRGYKPYSLQAGIVLLCLFPLYGAMNAKVAITKPVLITLGSGAEYEKAFEELYMQPDILQKDTLVYIHYPQQYIDGIKILLSKNGIRDLPNLCFEEAEFISIFSSFEKNYVIEAPYKLSGTVSSLLKEKQYEFQGAVGSLSYVSSWSKKR